MWLSLGDIGALSFFPLLPFFHGVLPRCLFATGHGLLLFQGLVASLITCTFSFHIGDGGIVKNLNSATAYGLVQFFLAKSLALFIKVGDIKLVVHTQLVSYFFLLRSVASVL